MEESKLHVVLLAGGKGERLHPLSTDECPKQFLRLFDTHSLLQQTIERVLPLAPDTITVLTTRQYLETAQMHIDEIFSRPPLPIEVMEDYGHGTALAMHTAFCKHLLHKPDDIFLFCPCDHVIDSPIFFVGTMKRARKIIVGTEQLRLILFGKTPEYIEPRYGYYLTTDSELSKFLEKPTIEEIEKIMTEDNVQLQWNTGIFMAKATTFTHLLGLGEHLKKGCRISEPMKNVNISFDKAILEKMPLQIARSESADLWNWHDIGSWECLIRYLATRQR